MTPLPYPHPRRLLWAARIVAAACVLLAALIVLAATELLRAESGAGPAAGAATSAPAFEAAALALLTAFSAAVLAYAVVGFPLRCAACGRRILAEWTGPKEPSARAVSGLNAWAPTVVAILRHHQFRCNACGVEQTLVPPR